MDWDALLNAPLAALFGDTVSYQAQGADPVDIVMSWTEGKAVEAANPGVQALAFAPVSSFAQPPQKGDIVIRSGRLYKVIENPVDYLDTTGAIRLPLRFMQDAA